MAFAMIVTAGVNYKMMSDKSTQTSYLTIESAHAGYLDDLAEWYLSEIYDCVTTTTEVNEWGWGYGTWGDVKDDYDPDWIAEFGGSIDDDQDGAFYGVTGTTTETEIECVDGDTVAHCSDC